MLFKLLHPKILRELEEDAQAQAKFHLILAWFWGVSMIGIVFVRVLWQNYPALVIEEISLWANFATHLGALSAAQASSKADTPRQPPPLAVD
jgi:hypothetical protein